MLIAKRFIGLALGIPLFGISQDQTVLKQHAHAILSVGVDEVCTIDPVGRTEAAQDQGILLVEPERFCQMRSMREPTHFADDAGAARQQVIQHELRGLFGFKPQHRATPDLHA